MDIKHARREIQRARDGRAIALDILAELIDHVGLLTEKVMKQQDRIDELEKKGKPFHDSR